MVVLMAVSMAVGLVALKVVLMATKLVMSLVGSTAAWMVVGWGIWLGETTVDLTVVELVVLKAARLDDKKGRQLAGDSVA
jgi:uncharacterized protein (DUF697 family)